MRQLPFASVTATLKKSRAVSPLCYEELCETRLAEEIRHVARNYVVQPRSIADRLLTLPPEPTTTKKYEDGEKGPKYGCAA